MAFGGGQQTRPSTVGQAESPGWWAPTGVYGQALHRVGSSSVSPSKSVRIMRAVSCPELPPTRSPLRVLPTMDNGPLPALRFNGKTSGCPWQSKRSSRRHRRQERRRERTARENLEPRRLGRTQSLDSWMESRPSEGGSSDPELVRQPQREEKSKTDVPQPEQRPQRMRRRKRTRTQRAAEQHAMRMKKPIPGDGSPQALTETTRSSTSKVVAAHPVAPRVDSGLRPRSPTASTLTGVTTNQMALPRNLSMLKASLSRPLFVESERASLSRQPHVLPHSSQRAGSSSLPRAAGSRRIWAGSRRYHRTTHLAGPARVETSLMRTPQRDSCTRAPPREDKTSTSICVYCYSRVFFSCHCLTVAIHPFPSPAGTKNPHPDSLGSATAKRKQSIRKVLEITSNGSLLVMISQATARLLVDVP